jgi:hypothetical protein
VFRRWVLVRGVGVERNIILIRTIIVGKIMVRNADVVITITMVREVEAESRSTTVVV